MFRNPLRSLFSVFGFFRIITVLASGFFFGKIRIISSWASSSRASVSTRWSAWLIWKYLFAKSIPSASVPTTSPGRILHINARCTAKCKTGSLIFSKACCTCSFFQNFRFAYLYAGAWSLLIGFRFVYPHVSASRKAGRIILNTFISELPLRVGIWSSLFL